MTNGIFRIGFHRLGVLLCLLSIIAQLTISPHPSFAQEKGVTGCAASLYSVDGQHTQPVGTGFLGRSTQPGPHGAVSNSYAATTLQQVLQGNDPVSLEDTPTQILIVDDFDAPSRAMSHGHDVFDVAQSLLNGLGGGTIQIKEVNAGQGYDLPTLIDKTLTAIQQGSDTFKRFVVNMSFIIVACEATV